MPKRQYLLGFWRPSLRNNNIYNDFLTFLTNTCKNDNIYKVLGDSRSEIAIFTWIFSHNLGCWALNCGCKEKGIWGKKLSAQPAACAGAYAQHGCRVQCWVGCGSHTSISTCSTPRVNSSRGPNLVNRAHWNSKENR